MSLALQTSQVPSQSDAPLPRLGRALAEAWTITRRDLYHWRLQPGTVVIGWLLPVMVVLMFGLLFGGAIRVPAGESYFEFVIPGMFVITMLFGIETTLVAVTTDAARGITDRFRSMPISSAAIVLGCCIADMLNSIVGLAIMIVAGLVLGWRWHGSVGAALAAVALLLLLRFAILWIGIYVGLNAKGVEVVSAVQILVWPLSFLSNVFVDPSTMPFPLGAIAEWNPLSATTTATRELFMNPGWPGTSWASENAILLAILFPLLAIAIFLPLSVRKYRRLAR